MMKKVTVFTLFSLLGLGGYVVGFSGPDLAGAEAKSTVKCSDLPNVEACILIMKNGKVEVVAGDGKKLRKPKKKGSGSPDAPKPGTKKNHDDLPSVLEQDITADLYTQHDITIYGDETCVKWNGVYYCW